jgi:hypothetical protein
MVKETRMMPQLSQRIAGMALRMVAVALRIMIVEWPRRIATSANVNHTNMSALANVRCNCWPSVQTSLYVKSMASTIAKVGASITCSARGKYKRYILASYFIYYT